jgi:regulator of replication initiation timing
MVLGNTMLINIHFILFTALDDLKKKVLSSNKEKKRLQDKIQSLTQENSFLKDQVQFSSTIEKENEALKEKLELSFKAFDGKYKESENLKQKLKTIKK